MGVGVSVLLVAVVGSVISDSADGVVVAVPVGNVLSDPIGVLSEKDESLQEERMAMRKMTHKSEYRFFI